MGLPRFGYVAWNNRVRTMVLATRLRISRMSTNSIERRASSVVGLARICRCPGSSQSVRPYARYIRNERTDRDQASHSDSRAGFDGANRLARVGGLVSGHDQCLQESRRGEPFLQDRVRIRGLPDDWEGWCRYRWCIRKWSSVPKRKVRR